MVFMSSRFGLPLVLGFTLLAAAARAQEPQYKVGDIVEYQVGSTFPHVWERGQVIKVYPGGKQYLIRQKPTQFFPEGFECAHYPETLRRPQAAKPAPKPDDNRNDPAPKAEPRPPVVADPKGDDDAVVRDGTDNAKGLLSKEDILAYAAKVFGGTDKMKNRLHPQRAELLDNIRDHIKKHGTNFKASATDQFYTDLEEQGASSVEIYFAIGSNYGAHPKVDNYFGSWHMRASNRGSTSVERDKSGKVLVRTTNQANSGLLTINKDGTYVWQLQPSHPPEKWVRGKWREAKPNEMRPTEGGPAIWLINAKEGTDYMVRGSREVGYADWIDVGAGKARSPVEYGWPQAAK